MFQGVGRLYDAIEFLQEPAVYLCEVVYLVYGVTLSESLRDNEYTLVGGVVQGFVYIGDDKLFVLYKAVHALSYHAQSFLYSLLKRAAYGHDFAYRFHARPQLAVYALELA